MGQRPLASAMSGVSDPGAPLGRTKGKIGFHGGKVEIDRPRVHGVERVLPSWENAVGEDWLGKWAMNQMLINVSTRRFKRSGCPREAFRRPTGRGCRSRRPPAASWRCRRRAFQASDRMV